MSTVPSTEILLAPIHISHILFIHRFLTQTEFTIKRMSVASIPCPAGINGTCYPTPVYRFIEENQSLQILPQYKAGGEKRWGGFGPRRKIQAGYVDTEKR